jgi:branched-chain amino acid transport system permease protein
MTSTAAPAPPAELPQPKTDWIPILLVPVLAIAALPLFGDTSAWVTLTLAGLAMGMMIFLMASGLTLVFGLMDVINFGHGVFISLGAYAALIALGPLAAWGQADSVALNLALLLACIVVAAGRDRGGRGGVRAGDRAARLRQPPEADPRHHGRAHRRRAGDPRDLGRVAHPVALPQTLRGAFVLGDIVMERYRVVAVVIGLVTFGLMYLILNRTRIGLIIRAGVENPEMVEALGYRIRRLFVGVFVAGSALAGLGGVMWGFYRQTLTAGMGMEVMVLVFIVIIVGGLGSIGGCFVGSLLVALVANYVGFLAPKLALISNILVMALVLVWRPQGLFPVARR